MNIKKKTRLGSFLADVFLGRKWQFVNFTNLGRSFRVIFANVRRGYTKTF